jgi:hypothetical protein
MTNLVTDEQATAQWHGLVKEAESHSGIALDEEIECYLVFLLMRYTQKPEMAAKVMALEYLRGVQAAGAERQTQLRDVGDQCLLYSGLFPKRAEHRQVRISYYVDLGRSAYHNVAEITHKAMSKMYLQLANGFVEMMDTLQAMRSLQHKGQEVLDPIRAFELWNDTHSKRARQVLTQTTPSIPVWHDPKNCKRH